MLLAAYFYHRPLAPLALWSAFEFAYMVHTGAFRNSTARTLVYAENPCSYRKLQW